MTHRIGILTVLSICAVQVAAAADTTPTQTAAAPITASAAATTASATPVKLKSGVEYIDEKIGTGAAVGTTSTIKFHYVGTLKNGRVFDSSRDQIVPNPAELKLGESILVPGLEEGLQGMRAGGRRRIIVPPEQAYGSQGRTRIPPNSTLIFDVEVLRVK